MALRKVLNEGAKGISMRVRKDINDNAIER